jgi:hypothetical protein
LVPVAHTETLALKHTLVHLAGGQVVVALEPDIHPTLVVTEIKINFACEPGKIQSIKL